MEQYSTNNVFEVVKGQLERTRGVEVDDIVIFDGTLQEAIATNMSQGVASGQTYVFIGLADASSDSTSGYGLPVREGLLVDIYVVVRSSGKSRYAKDRESLWDISDAIVHDCFLHTNWSTEAQKVFGGTEYAGRVRQPTGSETMAHLIRFLIKPQRKR